MFDVWFWVGVVIATIAIVIYELKLRSKSSSSTGRQGESSTKKKCSPSCNDAPTSAEDDFDIKEFLKYLLKYICPCMVIICPIIAIGALFWIDFVGALVSLVVVVPVAGFFILQWERSRKDDFEIKEELYLKRVNQASKWNRYQIRKIIVIGIPISTIIVFFVIQFWTTLTFTVTTVIFYGLFKMSFLNNRSCSEGEYLGGNYVPAQASAIKKRKERRGSNSRQLGIATREAKPNADFIPSCSICRKPIYPNNKLHECRSCGSLFHLYCIRKWVFELKHRLCPYCKSSLGYVE